MLTKRLKRKYRKRRLLARKDKKRCLRSFKYLRAKGAEFGYPLCCINAFIRRVKRPLKYADIGGRKLSGTGYVPCNCCNRKTEKLLMIRIGMKRKIETKFPDAGKRLNEN